MPPLGCAPLPQVHTGFLSAYDSLRPAVLGLLGAMLGGERQRWRLFLTGHSLGGALATLCAWDVAHRRCWRVGDWMGCGWVAACEAMPGPLTQRCRTLLPPRVQLGV